MGNAIKTLLMTKSTQHIIIDTSKYFRDIDQAIFCLLKGH